MLDLKELSTTSGRQKRFRNTKRQEMPSWVPIFPLSFPPGWPVETYLPGMSTGRQRSLSNVTKRMNLPGTSSVSSSGETSATGMPIAMAMEYSMNMVP